MERPVLIRGCTASLLCSRGDTWEEGAVARRLRKVVFGILSLGWRGQWVIGILEHWEFRAKVV